MQVLVVGGVVCGEGWRGCVRGGDVRIGGGVGQGMEGGIGGGGGDGGDVHFRVGDLVRGRVVSFPPPSFFLPSGKGGFSGERDAN